MSQLWLHSPGAAPDMQQQGLYVGDVLGMHLGMQHMHDGEDGEDGKGGSSMEGGSQAWQLLGVIPLPWGPPGWLWRPWECPGTHACSTIGPCMHHGRYKSPTTQVDSLGHPPSIINNSIKCSIIINVLEIEY